MFCFLWNAELYIIFVYTFMTEVCLSDRDMLHSINY